MIIRRKDYFIEVKVFKNLFCVIGYLDWIIIRDRKKSRIISQESHLKR
jgi:hypothetical protein